jgi:hypothetical protein
VDLEFSLRTETERNNQGEGQSFAEKRHFD